MSRNLYKVTYAFGKSARTEYRHPVATIIGAVRRMQNEDIEIEFVGGTQEVNANGYPIEVTARFTAPTKGTIGRWNCRTGLPASGPPVQVAEQDSAKQNSAS